MSPHSPAQVYRELYRRYGPQGWWPVALRSGSPAYHPGRYKPPSPAQAFEIAVGAILTQNTAWINVEKAVTSLLRAKALQPHVLESMPQRRLERLIRSSGYFRQKAARLKGFLRHVRSRGGLLRWLRAPLDRLRQELLAVPGIGPETADSIMLYAGARPAFVVDAYTLRIGARLGWFRGATYDEAQRYLARRLPRSVIVYQEFHALLVALAKFHCRTRPLCLACPLTAGCCYGSNHAR